MDRKSKLSFERGTFPQIFYNSNKTIINISKSKDVCNTTITREVELSRNKPELTYFLKIFLDVAFLLCLCPFRLKLGKSRSNVTPLYSAKRWWPQTIASGVLTIFVSFCMIRETYLSVPTSGKNPVLHFRFAKEVLNVIFKLLIIKLFWFNKKEIVNLVNFLIEKDFKSFSRKNARKEQFLASGLIVVFTGFTISMWASGAEIYGNNLGNEEIRCRNIFLKAGQLSIFSFVDIDILNSIFGGFATFEYLYRRIQGAYSDLFIFMVVLTLHTAAKSFSQYLSTCSSGGPPSIRAEGGIEGTLTITEQWSVICERFRSLKQLSRMTNKMIGTNLTCMAAYAILFFATSLDAVLMTQGGQYHGKVIKAMFFYFDVASVFLVAADICHQVFKIYI